VLAAAAIQAVGIDPAIGKALAAVLNDPVALDLALTTIAVTFLSQGGGLSIDDVAKKFLLQNGVTMRRGRRQADNFELQLQYKTTVNLEAVQAAAGAYNTAVASGGVMFSVTINGQVLQAVGVAATVPTADDVMMVCVENCPTVAPPATTIAGAPTTTTIAGAPTTKAPVTTAPLKQLNLTIEVSHDTLNATDIIDMEADVKAEIQKVSRDAWAKIQSITFTPGSSRRTRATLTTIATITFKDISDTELSVLVTAVRALINGGLKFTIKGVQVNVIAAEGSIPTDNAGGGELLAAACGLQSTMWMAVLASACTALVAG